MVNSSLGSPSPTMKTQAAQPGRQGKCGLREAAMCTADTEVAKQLGQVHTCTTFNDRVRSAKNRLIAAIESESALGTPRVPSNVCFDLLLWSLNTSRHEHKDE